ncbi:MAG: FAD-dependent oxidoreductase [Clostridia bacterium]|nr:FAD-dependent oxidoreductase [Clostridia bacterium]
MSKYQLKPREVELCDKYDVIVCGGGPAGCAAATAAAREGAKTLLIEASGMLGGMASLALVNAWTPYSDHEKVIYGGLSKYVFETTKSYMPHVDKNATEWVPIDYEALKGIYDDMVTSAGADILFHSFLSAVEMKDDNTVDTIIVSNKFGLTAYKAKVFVDCTGDADLCAWAGAEYGKGSETGELQPATHCFVLSNVDEYGYNYSYGIMHPGNQNSPIHKIVEEGKYDIPDKHMCNDFIGPKTMGFNAGHVWGVDNTDPITVSKGLIEGRKLARRMRDALAEYHPKAFANAYLAATGSNIGVRETRRIMGDYIFTIEDYANRSSFADEICRNNYYIDIHNTKEEGEEQKKGKSMWSDERYGHYGAGESHGIPYRCLTPKGLTNVLVAGRCISSDRIAQGSLRIMPACLCTGEAAGLAAKIAAESDKVDVHTVDTQRLRKRLIEHGGYLPKLPTDTF